MIAVSDVASATDCISIRADEDREAHPHGAPRCAYKVGNTDGAAAFWNAAAASGGIGFTEERAGAAEPTVTAAAAAARAAVDAVREKCAAKMAALAACEGQPAEEAPGSQTCLPVVAAPSV